VSKLAAVRREPGVLVARALGKLRRELLCRDALRLSRQYRTPGVGFSQGGEEGILREVFRRLGVRQGWAVEMGAWDGRHFSNTYQLLQDGWSGVGIECDPNRYRELLDNTRHLREYYAICRAVGREGDDRLDALLARTPLPRDFDLFSLDIDGYDYWIWDSLRDYRPSVVVIEYNALFSASEDKVLPFGHHVEWPIFGASAAALERLGRSKGYRLVACTPGSNLFFVREALAEGRLERLPVSCVPAEPAQVKRRWSGWAAFEEPGSQSFGSR
jgi:hypothetical protein